MGNTQHTRTMGAHTENYISTYVASVHSFYLFGVAVAYSIIVIYMYILLDESARARVRMRSQHIYVYRHDQSI